MFPALWRREKGRFFTKFGPSESRTKPSESARYGASFPPRGGLIGTSKSVQWSKKLQPFKFLLCLLRKISSFYRGAHVSLVRELMSQQGSGQTDSLAVGKFRKCDASLKHAGTAVFVRSADRVSCIFSRSILRRAFFWSNCSGLRRLAWWFYITGGKYKKKKKDEIATSKGSTSEKERCMESTSSSTFEIRYMAGVCWPDCQSASLGESVGTTQPKHATVRILCLSIHCWLVEPSSIAKVCSIISVRFRSCNKHRGAERRLGFKEKDIAGVEENFIPPR